MQKLLKWLPLLILGTLILAACGGDEPELSQDDIETSEASYEVDFSDSTTFEVGEFPDGSSLRIENGQYIIQSPMLKQDAICMVNQPMKISNFAML